MKLSILKIGLLSAAFTLGCSIYGQNNNDVTADSILTIVKPLVNFNAPNGGYYSENFEGNINTLYCGAIVAKQVSSTIENVHLEVNAFNHSDELLFVTLSDTLLINDSISEIHLKTPIKIDNQYYINYLVYSIMSNNSILSTDTIPYPLIGYADWGSIARASESTNTTNITEIEGFNSGDFIGFRFTLLNNWQMASFHCYSSMNWPETTIVNCKIYKNDSLLYTRPVETRSGDWGWLVCVFLDEFADLQPDSNYVAGIEIIYEDDPSFSIGIDTRNYHNFEFESVARIDGKWESLNFVPVMKLVFNPESISENKISETTVYPNPTTGLLNFENGFYEKIEVFSLDGKLILTEINRTANTIDVSNLPDGMYILTFVGKNRISTAKFYIKK